MARKVTLRHKITGKVDVYPEHYLNHPVFGKQLEEVPEGTPVDGCTECGVRVTEKNVEECEEDNCPQQEPEWEPVTQEVETEEREVSVKDKIRNWYNSN